MRFVIAILLFSVAFSVQAQLTDTNSFTIKVFSGSDTTPPPAPTLNSVIPVASSQIDVAWGAVVDDVFLAGYVLYRDNVAIATTTLTNYSDSGLAASTTYSYAVQAFDSVGNYSSTSSSLATTTLRLPPPAATTSSSTASEQNSTIVQTVLEDFSLLTTNNTAQISLQTMFPARIQIRWGRSASYELGYSASDMFKRSFVTTITDLEPGTQYEYEIIGISPSGKQTVLKQGQFTTKNQTATTPPNVKFLTATAINSDVSLTWSSPLIQATSIRVVRSHLGFPASPNDGAIVYQGREGSFYDEGILEKHSPVYYSVFVYDIEGNVSSGAVAAVALDSSGQAVVISPTDGNSPPFTDSGTVEIFLPEATTTDPGINSAVVRIPNLNEIFVRTNTDTYTFASPEILISNDSTFTIQVPKVALSKNLKTILITITNPNNATKSYSYILRLSKDGLSYEAVIEGFEEVGQAQATLAVYDYQTRMISRYYKRFQFGESKRGEGAVLFPDYFLERPLQTLGVLAGLSLLLLVLLFLLVRRK